MAVFSTSEVLNKWGVTDRKLSWLSHQKSLFLLLVCFLGSVTNDGKLVFPSMIILDNFKHKLIT